MQNSNVIFAQSIQRDIREVLYSSCTLDLSPAITTPQDLQSTLLHNVFPTETTCNLPTFSSMATIPILIQILCNLLDIKQSKDIKHLLYFAVALRNENVQVAIASAIASLLESPAYQSDYLHDLNAVLDNPNKIFELYFPETIYYDNLVGLIDIVYDYAGNLEYPINSCRKSDAYCQLFSSIFLNKIQVVHDGIKQEMLFFNALFTSLQKMRISPNAILCKLKFACIGLKLFGSDLFCRIKTSKNMSNFVELFTIDMEHVLKLTYEPFIITKQFYEHNAHYKYPIIFTTSHAISECDRMIESINLYKTKLLATIVHHFLGQLLNGRCEDIAYELARTKAIQTLGIFFQENKIHGQFSMASFLLFSFYFALEIHRPKSNRKTQSIATSMITAADAIKMGANSRRIIKNSFSDVEIFLGTSPSPASIDFITHIIADSFLMEDFLKFCNEETLQYLVEFFSRRVLNGKDSDAVKLYSSIASCPVADVAICSYVEKLTLIPKPGVCMKPILNRFLLLLNATFDLKIKPLSMHLSFLKVLLSLANEIAALRFIDFSHIVTILTSPIQMHDGRRINFSDHISQLVTESSFNTAEAKECCTYLAHIAATIYIRTSFVEESKKIAANILILHNYLIDQLDKNTPKDPGSTRQQFQQTNVNIDPSKIILSTTGNYIVAFMEKIDSLFRASTITLEQKKNQKNSPYVLAFDQSSQQI
ncbi:MAG: hypothetical protein LBI69_00780 [Puniceicoccales bacterium]|jgi:hypothetical protein|nr:hypothetical protein [Puniceicoccales bacterium]